LRRARAARTLASMRDPRDYPQLLTPAEMGGADRFAISTGTLGIVLMERAGHAVAEEAARLTKSRGRIAVLCGPGGNGVTAASPRDC
jgi:NAD(P)H-hydrate repair Nnr-like enzyme with NAD(P)H-hydrate epimerase domain